MRRLLCYAVTVAGVVEVAASDNVVLEDLHNTRNLETTYYVTDMTQASDFYWDRESGLRVNIGILNVHLIPEYEDVDHDGDNSYMLKNPNNSEDKSKYLSVLRHFCRFLAALPSFISTYEQLLQRHFLVVWLSCSLVLIAVLSRCSRQRERLSASMLSICSSVCLFVCLSSKCKKTRFSQKLSNLGLWCLLTTYMGFSKNPLLDP